MFVVFVSLFICSFAQSDCNFSIPIAWEEGGCIWNGIKSSCKMTGIHKCTDLITERSCLVGGCHIPYINGPYSNMEKSI